VHNAVCTYVVETETETDKAKPPMPNFAPSKWETVDESELEAQGNLSSLLIVFLTDDCKVSEAAQ